MPAPSTPGLVGTVTGGAAVVGGRGGSKFVGILVVLAIVVVAAIAVFALYRAFRPKEGFYTLYASEQPTRPYTPYTGTIPYGTWGTKPWAYEFERISPNVLYDYLPPAYRYPVDAL